jgi:ABC-type multidrug transport system permease subunit
MFMLSMMLFNLPMFSNVLVFQMERATFLREYCNQMYSLPAYLISKILVEMPVNMILPLLMLLIMNWSVGYNSTVEAFFMQYFALELNVINASALGFIISANSESFVAANTFAPAIAIPVLLFGGLVVNLSLAPKWLAWI